MELIIDPLEREPGESRIRLRILTLDSIALQA
jgi:hypothetical protein